MLSHYRKNIPNFADFTEAMTEKLFSGDESALSAIIDDLAPYDIFDFIARISSLGQALQPEGLFSLGYAEPDRINRLGDRIHHVLACSEVVGNLLPPENTIIS